MSSVRYESGGHDFERRIGVRTRPEGLVITWVPGPHDGQRGHHQPTGAPGRVVDVSVTGAAILGPADLTLEPHTRALIRHEGEDSWVIVRRSEPTTDPAMRLYGVELVEIEPGLKRRIYEAGSPDRDGESLWDLGGR